ncbi:amidoligase family protein, partial [Herbiconiux daphne]
MTTVASTFDHNSPPRANPHPNLAYNSHVGIELEIEECTYIDLPFWDCKEDGSLRNGCELVCSQPYAGETLYQAIEALAENVGASSAQGTWRCSTHVHLDVRDLEAPALKKLILAYAFYEKVLFKCSGFHRYRSNFCPAFAVVQQQIFNVSTAFNSNGERFFTQLLRGWDKYTSLNLLPLREFGSVEFRISEPKWKRTNVLNLVNRYLVLKKLAVENAGMSNQEFVEYLRSVAFEPMLPYLPFDYNPDPEDLELGWQVANDILATRANGVEVHQRVRDSATGEDGSVVVPLSELGHWRAYMQYVYNSTSRWAQRNISDITGE